MVGRVILDPSGLLSLCGVVPRVPILINNCWAAWWRWRRQHGGVYMGGRSWVVGLRTKICCNLLFFPSHFFQNPLNIIIEGGKFKTTTDSLMPNPSRLKPSSACPRAQPPSSSRCIALLSGRLPAITLASLSLSLAQASTTLCFCSSSSVVSVS
jgi:hypothetical protein